MTMTSLYTRCVNGEPEAWEELITKYDDTLKRYQEEFLFELVIDRQMTWERIKKDFKTEKELKDRVEFWKRSINNNSKGLP